MRPTPTVMTPNAKKIVPCAELRGQLCAPLLPGQEDYLCRSVSNLSYQCARSGRSVGPDDAPVSPEECDGGRLCYEPLG